MYYDKRIRYIDYLENGEKRRNCGYVKITVTDGRLLLEMQIKGLYMTDDVASEVMLEGADAESRIGTVMIRQGCGNFSWEIQDPTQQGEEISLGEGLRYGHLERISVRLSSHRSLYCIWRERETGKPAVMESVMESTVREQKLWTDEAEQPEGKDVPVLGTDPETPDEQREEEVYVAAEAEEQVEQLWEPQTQPESEPTLAQEATLEQEVPQDQEELHTAETQPKVSQEPPAMPMSEDKWQQLQRIYPHICPFQDEREYLSLRPEDFVILRSDAYRLVQNSFLLHGFYNYKHLILTHVSQKNVGKYYIGVPGNFYEKEKQVAIMYGFDSFECKQEPAGEGDFGYYMIRVEL